MFDDKALRNVLRQKIKNIKEYPRSIQKKVEFEMATKYNVKFGDIVDIFNGISPNTVDEISYNMLYKLTKSIYSVAMSTNSVIDSSDLYIPKYFTKQEELEFELPYPDEEKDFDLVITDWKQVSDTKYKIYTNINEVIQWRNHNKLRFNPETQRDLITISSSDKNIKKLDINRSAINQMKNLMKKGLYYNVCGILNINPDFDYEYLPYKDGRNLIIPKECHIDLIEGFHNYIAETELKDEDPNFEFEIEFTLMILDTERANDLISQMDKKTHFRIAQANRIDRTNEVTYIVNTLNTRSTYHLYGTIDNVMKSFLNKLITRLYGIVLKREESLTILSNIIDCLNYIIEKNNRLDKPLDKKEYFIYISMVKFAENNELNFNDFYNLIDERELFNNIKSYNASPITIKTINKYLKEVIKNAL